MERDFQSRFVKGEGSGTFSPAFMLQASDDACFDALFSGISLQSLLNINNIEKSPLALHDSATETSHVGFPATLSFVPEDFLGLSHKQLAESSVGEDQRLRAVNFDREKLKMPKDEPLENVGGVDNPREPFNFMSNGPGSMSKLCDSSFYHLPELRSLEQVANTEKDRVRDDFSHGESSNKRVISYSECDSYTLDAIVRSFKLSNSVLPYKSGESPRFSPVIPQNTLARQRRQRISEKTRCLQKLLPWDKKMDMATMLGEAYKYIKFLQAQLSVLHSMPCDNSCFDLQNTSNFITASFGGLGRLNRQQLLQVLVNSPVAQTKMYSQGCCVFSVEQLALLNQMAERRVYLQRMLFDSSKL